MSTYWSTYVQTPEELYRSRALRFRDDNKDGWFKLLRAKNGMDVLEIGCGGGIFCHRIKSYLPDCTVTGLDLDENNIAFAQTKAAKNGLDCTFVQGAAERLPFPDGCFDLCFSHTVADFCDPDAFYAEQMRVLRPGGVMVVLNVACRRSNEAADEGWKPSGENDEKALFDKLWAVASQMEPAQIKRYPADFSDCMAYMEKAGFAALQMDALAVVQYCPDSANTGNARAIEQIEECRLSMLSSVHKARIMAPDTLTEAEWNDLLRLIHERFDRRLAQYKRGEWQWDYNIGTTAAVSGRKPI